MRRRIGHSPAAAGIAETPMPTRVGNQTIQTACSAMHTDETSRKDPTIQEGTELTFDEFRHIPVTLALPGKKSFQMSGNDTIEGIPINEGLRTIARDKRRSVYQSDFNSPEVRLWSMIG